MQYSNTYEPHPLCATAAGAALSLARKAEADCLEEEATGTIVLAVVEKDLSAFPGLFMVCEDLQKVLSAADPCDDEQLSRLN